MSYKTNKAQGNPAFSEKQDGTRSYGIKYMVESSTVNDVDFKAARNATGMPQAGDTYINDSGVFAGDATLEDIKHAIDKTIFVFGVDYSGDDGGGSIPNTEKDPTKQNPKVSWSCAKYTVPFIKAWHGTDDVIGTAKLAVLNTAGQKHDPPPVTLRINKVVNIQYNIRKFDSAWFDKVNTLNQSQETILDLHVRVNEARINDMNASDAYDSKGKQYWQISITIEFGNFDLSLLNLGFMALNTARKLDNVYTYANALKTTPETRCFTKCLSDMTEDDRAESDKFISQVSEPHLLDAEGKLLAAGADPVYTTYRQNQETSWSELLVPKVKKYNIRSL